MPTPNRFEIVAPLPSSRRHLLLAVDRGSTPPRAVVLALYPRAVSDDPGRLGRLAGEMERAAQLIHPNVLAPVSIEELGEDLAALTIWRDAITLRELIDAGGALPHEIAVRIAMDVCAGLAHAHGRPEPVVHGLLRPEAVLLDENGVAMVSGFGMPGGSGIADDVLGLGELLHECLAGEPPEGPSVPLPGSEAPPALVTAVNRARAPRPEGRPPDIEALGETIGQAVTPASHETVAAYVNAVMPAKNGVRAERREKIAAALAAPPFEPQEISEDDIFADAFQANETGAPDPSTAPAAAANGSGAGGPADPSSPLPDAAAPSIDLDIPPSPGPSTEAEVPVPPPSEPPDTTLRVELPSPAAKPGETARHATPTSTRKPTSTPTPPATAAVAASPRPSPPVDPDEREGSPAAESRESEEAKAAEQPESAEAEAAERPESEEAPAAQQREAKDAAAKGPVREERTPTRGRRVSLAAALLLFVVGVAGGFALAVFTPWREVVGSSLRHAAESLAPSRTPEPTPAPAPPEPVPAANPYVDAPDAEESAEPSKPAPEPPPAPVRSAPPHEKKKRVRQAATPASGDASGGRSLLDAATGFLVVTAPEDTEVLLDGKLIGKGDTKKQIPVGKHRLDVRRGRAKLSEKFSLAPGESWTYTVTEK